MRTVIEYFQVNALIDAEGSSVFLTILYITTIIEVIMLLLIITVTYKVVQNRKNTSTLFLYTVKFCSIFFVCLNSILSLPFFNIFVATLYCNDKAPFSQGFTCYEGLYFLHISISLIGLLIYFFFITIFGYLLVDLKYVIIFNKVLTLKYHLLGPNTEHFC